MVCEKTARYDRAKKKVFVSVKEELPIMDGTEQVGATRNRHDQEFTPKHIRKVWKMLHEQKGVLDKMMKENKDAEEYKFMFDYERLDELRRMQSELEALAKLEKAKAEREFLVTKLDSLKEDIRVLSGVIKDLK
jgi:hypothetical protein